MVSVGLRDDILRLEKQVYSKVREQCTTKIDEIWSVQGLSLLSGFLKNASSRCTVQMFLRFAEGTFSNRLVSRLFTPSPGQ